MDSDGPFVVMVILILCTTAVLILRPIASRLGHLLEALTTERLSRAHRSRDDVSALLIALDEVQQRLRTIEHHLGALPPGERDRLRLPAATDVELRALASRIRGPHSDGTA